jgi:hypothetical protein
VSDKDAGRGLGKAHVRVTGAWASANPPQQAGRFYRGLPAADQGLDPAFLMGVADVFDEAEDLMIGRHRDYGPGNIANAYPDPLTALVVRMGDKSERIKHLLSSSHSIYGESLRDSWLDLANYGLIGVMVIDGKWPGVKGTKP